MPAAARPAHPLPTAQVQADLRRRILRAFVGRGLIEGCDAKEILALPVNTALGVALAFAADVEVARSNAKLAASKVKPRAA